MKKILNFDIAYLLKTTYLHISYVVVSILPFFWIINFFQSSFVRLIISSSSSLSWLFLMIYLLGFDGKEKNMTRKQLFKIVEKVKHNWE